jgi:hypothetical protein
MPPPPKGIGGVEVPPVPPVPPPPIGKSPHTISNLSRKLDQEIIDRIDANLALSAQIREVKTDLSEHRSESEEREKRTKTSTWWASGAFATIVVAVITALGAILVAKINSSQSDTGLKRDDATEAIRALRDDLARQNSRIEGDLTETRRAIQQRPLVRDPDVVSATPKAK